MTATDIRSFLRAWIANPARIGAIAPSGAMLAALITREISPGNGPVLELGPGTGTFTRALLERGVPESDLTLVEFSPQFARLLHQRFPAANIRRMDAARLTRAKLFEDAPCSAVVSGLPLLSLPPRKVFAILTGAFSYLQPGGTFYQFTYGPRCPVRRRILDRLGLTSTRIGEALLNVPPAAVYRISRRPTTDATASH
ncbi:class I SAM-dependent methyltransferase [Arhodomonas sp. AD133]|uniref:class I SAM-dependent methyltransferase n=1 Tax=Arhodomonas sp. AD133 TaxID=3415009 RepID=UPI003EB9E9CD